MISPFPPEPHPADVLGRASRKGVKVILEAHLGVLDGRPLRAALSEALREDPSLGGQERRFIALAVRELSRHQRLLDHVAKHLGQSPSKWVLREDQSLVRFALWRRLFTGQDWNRIKLDVQLPGPIRPRSIKDSVLEEMVSTPLGELSLGATEEDRIAARHSFSTWLARAIATSTAGQPLEEILAALNRESSVVLRVRPGKTAQEACSELQAEGVAVEILVEDPPALVVREASHRVFDSALFKSNAVQQQDVGSQWIAELCRPSRGEAFQRVADVCAGAGGKTLALADQVGPGGKVFASDLSRRRLEEGRTRIKAAGLRNVSFPHPLDVSQMQAVLVDAPCSGTGSLAREPDQKWKLKEADIARLVTEQLELLEGLAPKLKPGAVLVYATCSLLRAENEDVVAAFGQKHPEYELTRAESVLPQALAPHVSAEGFLRVYPHRSPGGGFFAARWVRRSG
jgi:16S rRNA (cytosine967-C5)-methyltransferase